METPRRIASNEGIRDQIRRYHVSVDVVTGDKNEDKTFEGGIFDNYQIEGEMNQTRASAKDKLINAGYSNDEAEAYIEAIPVRVVEEKVYISKKDFDYLGMTLVNQQIAQIKKSMKVTDDGIWL
jgi:hypothetical protein